MSPHGQHAVGCVAARLVALMGTASQGALRKWSGLGLGVYVVLSTPKPEGSAHIRMWSSRAVRCLGTGRLWQHRQSSLNTTFGLKSCHYGAVQTQAAGRQSGWRTPHTALGTRGVTSSAVVWCFSTRAGLRRYLMCAFCVVSVAGMDQINLRNYDVAAGV
jgi:hypothetical protein